LRASNIGCPVTLSEATGVTARAYADAARRLNGEEIEMIVPSDKKGLLVKLFGRRAA
jgi:septum site-determining protein MinD